MKGDLLMDSLKEGTIPIPDINIIEEGSLITIGNARRVSIIVDHHFNWFQKRMLKWFFGFIVEDYSNVDRE